MEREIDEHDRQERNQPEGQTSDLPQEMRMRHDEGVFSERLENEP